MSVEENKAIARRLIEEINQGTIAATAHELLAPNLVLHDTAFPEPFYEPAGFNQVINMFRAAFPDFSMTSEDIVAEGDKVAFRWIFRGTHKGQLMDMAPTNRQVAITGISMYRISDGKLREGWIVADMLSMFQQLGVIPVPGQSTG